MWKHTKNVVENINKNFENINSDYRIKQNRKGTWCQGELYVLIKNDDAGYLPTYFNSKELVAMNFVSNKLKKELEKEKIYIIENLDLFESSYYIKAVGEQEALDKWYDLYGDEYFKDINEFKKADDKGDMIVYELSYD